ncbi:MAG: hypothetical protein EXR93_11865 [Gemmatimonadetes bacterium]|nr:hypothetical protein [Gemmatimonadota bacterium]
MPALVPSDRGGMLYTGGVPGNAGGTGRPASALREQLRGSFEQRIPVLEAIADDQEQSAGDRIRALDTLAKYGLGPLQGVSADQVRERLRATLQIIYEELDEPQAQRVINRLRGAWA